MRTALALAFALGGLGSGTTPLGVPPELADYRTWSAGEVHLLSAPMEALCDVVSPAERAQRTNELVREQGPHAQRYLRAYANALASSVATEATDFPVGSVIVKEKLLSWNGLEPYAVAFMIKRPLSERPASGGWEFRFYPEQPLGTTRACVDCHRVGGSRDYVFTRLPFPGAGER